MITDRVASISDLDLILSIEQNAFPEERWASEGSLRKRMQLFAQGTWLGLCNERPVAFSNGFPIGET